jgi:hypothetical protein
MPDETPRSRERFNDLYVFLSAIDKSFAVRAERLTELPSTASINFGGLVVSTALQVYWQSVARIPAEYVEFHSSMLEWIYGLFDCVLLEIMEIPSEEYGALKQVLSLHLPPHYESPPERYPPCDTFVTLISNIANTSSSEVDDYVSFIETNACVSPVPPVVYLRDLVVLLILNASKTNRVYNSRTREVLFLIADNIALDPQAIRLWETSVGELLHGGADFTDHSASVSESTRWSQRTKIAAATVGGATLLAVTGGLALPAISAVFATLGVGLGSIGLGAVGSVLIGGSVLLGSIGIAGGMVVFGGVGAGLAGMKLSKRWGELNVEDFKFKRLRWKKQDENSPDFVPHKKSTDALELSICVSGYLRDKNDYNDPWRCMRVYHGGLCENYTLRWERENLGNLGSVLLKMMATEVAGTITSAWLNMTVGAAAATMTAPVMIISIMSDLDNSWLVVRDRAYQCGEALAHSISSEDAIGLRPVTLVGYSMGALAIFHCLQTLALNGHYNRIQNVILMGAPIPSTFAFDQQRTPWRNARAVVSGRFINCYNSMDALLGFLCRFLEWGVHIAGIGTVDEPGIENVDVGHLLNGHSDYPAKVREVLKHAKFI